MLKKLQKIVFKLTKWLASSQRNHTMSNETNKPLEENPFYTPDQATFARSVAEDLMRAYVDIRKHLDVKFPNEEPTVKEEVTKHCSERWVDIVLQQLMTQHIREQEMAAQLAARKATVQAQYAATNPSDKETKH